MQLDFIDSGSEEEFIAVGRGEMRRKSPTEGRDYGLDSEMIGSADEGLKAKANTKNRRR